MSHASTEYTNSKPLQKKNQNITTGLTGELFHLSPCDVVSFGCESSIPHISSNFIEFIAGNGIVYLLRAFKLHPSFLQSGLVEKTNRCHCGTFIYFFNLEKRKIYVKFLLSVYFPFLVPGTVSLRSRFAVKVSIVRNYLKYFNFISFNDLTPF